MDLDDDWRNDDAYSFYVTCSRCSTHYDNRENSCPNCRSCDAEYSGDDAKRWNDHLRRTGR